MSSERACTNQTQMILRCASCPGQLTVCSMLRAQDGSGCCQGVSISHQRDCVALLATAQLMLNAEIHQMSYMHQEVWNCWQQMEAVARCAATFKSNSKVARGEGT